MAAPVEILLADERATSRLAQRMAPLLVAGDVVLLEGPIGAGKTHFCRALIQARLGVAEDVPSPTFTLVQTYVADVEIWHADLYRLSCAEDARELGLEQAFATAICLIEWADRLGPEIPPNPIRIILAPDGEGRRVSIDPNDRPEMLAMLQGELREAAIVKFLAGAGWQSACRMALGGDASARRYERLHLSNQTRLLMDAPPGQSDSVADFARIDRHLLQIGLSVPIIHAQDPDLGFMLIEDFGNGVFSRLMDENAAKERLLYTAAIDALVHLQSHAPTVEIDEQTNEEWAKSTDVALHWYRFAVTGDRIDSEPLALSLRDHLARLATLPQVMILRDYHAENLMWLPDRVGVQRVGLLDFQLAQMGQPGYDLVSLLQDARRDVNAEVEAAMILYFVTRKNLDKATFLPGYAVLGVLRALRILGVFSRLCLVMGKPQYVALLPRVWAHLQRNLAHPELRHLRAVCESVLPPVTDAGLQRIKAQCGNFQ